MADQESTDTTTTQEVDTSTNEETQDTNAELDLENDTTSFDDFEDTEDQEADSTEQNEEDADTEQQDDEEESEEDEATEDEEEQSTEPEEAELSDEQKRKEHNREMAERRLEAKRQREEGIAESQQKYLDEAVDDPKEAALRQLQVEAYNNRVEKHTNSLTNAYERAIKDFDILSDNTPEVQAEINDAIDAFQAQYVQTDQYGNPIDVKADLYKYLQSKADRIEQLTAKGKREQLKSKSKEKSKTFTQPVRAPKQPKSDPDLDGFDEEANRW